MSTPATPNTGLVAHVWTLFRDDVTRALWRSKFDNLYYGVRPRRRHYMRFQGDLHTTDKWLRYKIFASARSLSRLIKEKSLNYHYKIITEHKSSYK